MTTHRFACDNCPHNAYVTHSAVVICDGAQVNAIKLAAGVAFSEDGKVKKGPLPVSTYRVCAKK